MAKRFGSHRKWWCSLLGVNGVFMIAHEVLNKRNKTAIEITSDLVERKIIQHIRETMDIRATKV